MGGLLLAVLIPLTLSATPLTHHTQEPASEEEGGPLHDIIKQRNQTFLEHTLDHDGEAFTHFNSSFRYMSPQTFHELNEDLAVLSKKYRKLAYQNEMILPKDKLIPVKWSTQVSEYAICGKWPLVELEE